MSEKMREEFEIFVLHNHSYGAGCRGDGSYYSTKINDMWQAWKASRAALVVELPDVIGQPLAYHEAINDVKDALDDAGVDYK